MNKHNKYLVGILSFSLFFACRQAEKKPISVSDQQQFEKYLTIGDSIYTTKTGYDAFGRSMIYFDSATLLAQRLQDTVMLADGIFAKGRVYDAWNKEPEKTVAYFNDAFLLYKQSKKDIVRQYYIQHLIAHAYDKMQDSANCAKTLVEIYDSIKIKPIAIRKEMDFIPQMAYISTTVKNYDLADKILTNLYQRAWIINNPKSYNYEDFYFLTKSKIDIYKNKNNETRYLDSFALALRHIKNPSDSLWYIDELIKLNRYTKHYDKAYTFFNAYEKLNAHITNIQSMESMRNQLLNMELQAERRKAEAEDEAKRSKNIILWILIVAVAITSSLLLRIVLISKRLKQVNERIDNKMQQVQLANKEIQHRVKNNLHLIFSLLNMQERKAKSPEVVANLQNARLRIESIAALHDQLSRNENENVDFNAYTHHLIETIINCIETEYKVIANLDIKQINVPHNYYISIGLILNEWITNSIKYAKVNSSPLVLNIKMYYQNDNPVIEYFDNGIVNANTQTIGLGKEIIVLLSKQMKAQITYNANNPYHYFLTIKNGK